MEIEEKRKLFSPRVGQIFKKAYRPILDIVLPPAEISVQSGDMEGWENLIFLDEPCCQACGYPFEYHMGADQLCARCYIDQPVFDAARSALQYMEDSSGFILSFKHGGRTQHLERFARHMVRAGRQFWPQTDIIIPVPLHASRLRKRKFNQAALLARKISIKTELPMETHILRRHKDTASQGAQTARGRFRNVRGAFSVPQDKQALLEGRNIVLIDDVYTTGATLEACSRALKRVGANRVFALTLARVVKDQEIPT